MSRLPPTACSLVLLWVLGLGIVAAPPAAAGPAAALAEIETLQQRGGLAATRRLCALVRDGDDETRLAALRALTAVGVRSHGVADTLVQATENGASRLQRAAALEALGSLGGAQDVALLIDTLKGEDQSLRGVAHAALRTLTGARMRQDYGEWYRWWRQEARKKPADVRHAILRLPDVEGREWETLREVLARDGWTDAAYLEDALDDWLSAGDRMLRACAFHVAAAQRIGGVTPAAESALPHLTHVDGEDGLRAVRALGLDADLLAPYWRKRFESGR